jgi:peroxiredoxin
MSGFSYLGVTNKLIHVKRSLFLPAFIYAISLAAPAAAQNQPAAATAPIPVSDEMLNAPAPAFELRDLDGKTVSLNDYKGKIVILDFWATWCAPCKLSFPGMQIAIKKYKDDPDVKFFFIDTNEKIEHYADSIRKFIADNRYSLDVLLDDMGTEGKQDKVFKQYGTGHIPAKFIIDKKGIIRSVHIGYRLGRSDKDFAKEVSHEIEAAR